MRLPGLLHCPEGFRPRDAARPVPASVEYLWRNTGLNQELFMLSSDVYSFMSRPGFLIKSVPCSRCLLLDIPAAGTLGKPHQTPVIIGVVTLGSIFNPLRRGSPGGPRLFQTLCPPLCRITLSNLTALFFSACFAAPKSKIENRKCTRLCHELYTTLSRLKIA